MINTHLTEFVPFFKPRIPKIDNVKDKLIDFKVCFTESGFEL